MNRIAKRLYKQAVSSPLVNKFVELRVINGDNNQSKAEQSNYAMVVAKRLIASLPLVPTNDNIYTIITNINEGLYDDLGNLVDCDNNWDEWTERCMQLMKVQNKIG